MLTSFKMDNSRTATSRGIVSRQVRKQVRETNRGGRTLWVWERACKKVNTPIYLQVFFRVELIILDELREVVHANLFKNIQ